MRLRRLINNEPLKISLHLKKHSYPIATHFPFAVLKISRRMRVREEIHARLLLPRGRHVRSLCARHNSYAPTTKGRMRLDKNSYPSGNQCFTI